MKALKRLPPLVQRVAGQELRKVQNDLQPADWKPMKTVGPGVREIRFKIEGGAFRVIYLVTREEGVVVLHVFQKKTQKTPQFDLKLAASRLKKDE
jgi:phage-related protein